MHETYMRRALEIAEEAFPNCLPNPGVGAVIVFQDEIIGEGYTQAYGGSHAEVMAIQSVKNKDLLSQSTLYVTLEPCNHQGKTPACSSLIIESGIPRVMIAKADPNKVNEQNGIAFLRERGIEVEVGLCQRQAKELNKRFFNHINKKRPYIILKWAESQDGFMAPERGSNEKGVVWITGDQAQQLNHKWRSEEMAILIGSNTVIIDNPNLTVREWKGKNPIRIVIDKDLKAEPNSNAFNKEAITYIFNNQYNRTTEFNHWIKLDFSKNVTKQICDFLYELHIQSIIVEGGAYTLSQFIDNDLWDEARIFQGQEFFEKGLPSPKLNKRIVCSYKVGKDTLKIIYNTTQN